MSNIFQELSRDEFRDAQCGRDGMQSLQRFLVHEFPVSDELYQISVSQCINGLLAAIEKRLLIEPTCLVPIEEQRRYRVEFCVRELQRYWAHQDGRSWRLEDLAVIDNLPDFDCRLTCRYEVRVLR